jgi:hypothetical protein
LPGLLARNRATGRDGSIRVPGSGVEARATAEEANVCSIPGAATPRDTIKGW